MLFQHVCVIGLGYIGLPTSSILATQGVKVTGVDISPSVVDTINSGNIHIVERDLDVLVRSAVHSGNLRATLTACEADAFILAVPTPFKDGHKPDLSYIEKATHAIAPYIKPGNLIILESTSPVGTTEKVAKWLYALRPDLVIPGFSTDLINQIFLTYCPERVLPGRILQELVSNDRVIGGIDAASAQKAKAFYGVFCQGKILLTDARTAEMVKLSENAFRDVNIAFANELANICDNLNINVWELIKLANHHPRVNILQPGPGVGGHCIAVDPWFSVDSAPSDAKLIRAAREVNDGRPEKILAQIHAALKHNPTATIACLGLSFKANIDDLRESPAVDIVVQLAQHVNNGILVVEPYIEALPEPLINFKNVNLVPFEEGLAKADILILLVNHAFFVKPDSSVLQNKTLLDYRGVWQ
jgi:UDP-N-acetyl-D-mannosaminuronic acid dehydrogenase